MLCTEEENEEQERESVYKPQEQSLLPLLPGYFECLMSQCQQDRR